ncbi:solute carrier family 23 member 2-like [Pecten maximus]|uniref:solute carrier family 23 member 2-like n=1 Tax=Pecten maximus TaxID=6579 RepID=UPI001458A4DC|nr:solute carrier family 23 member 2-like [Pecten maximus]
MGVVTDNKLLDLNFQELNIEDRIKFGSMKSSSTMLGNAKPENTSDVDTDTEEQFQLNPDHVVIECDDDPKLLYKISDRPPIHLSIFFALQQTIISLSHSLVVSAFVADVACASDLLDIRRDLLSSSLLMNGVTTLLMVTIGVRLPVFQGATVDYVLPFLAMKMINPDICKLSNETDTNQISNISISMNDSSLVNTASDMELKRSLALTKLSEFQGCLILVGCIHSLVGLTGISGLVIKFVGPITIVPAILLMSLFVCRSAVNFCRHQWGVSVLTAVTSLVLSMYLGNRKMPFPAWSRKKRFHIIWYPFHQVFSVLIGLLAGWGLSAVLTYAGVFSDDPSNLDYMARTDARAEIITNANWFNVPYPNRFGKPSLNTSVFIGFLIGTLTSIIDSIGDYYACARICSVPPPPRYVVNRGIAVEGIGTILSGIMGCGHATTTYGANIGVIGLTKVASRDVLLWTAIMYILFGLVGKVSAFFITIPHPVLGGAMIVLLGMLNGIILSNLQVASLSSTRNLAIIGISLLIGMMVPYWLEVFPDDLQTGGSYNNYIAKTLLSNPVLCGGVTAAFLDNTVPGTARERGITAWQDPGSYGQADYQEGPEVYAPPLPRRWLSWRGMKYIPFCQYKADEGSDEN